MVECLEKSGFSEEESGNTGGAEGWRGSYMADLVHLMLCHPFSASIYKALNTAVLSTQFCSLWLKLTDTDNLHEHYVNDRLCLSCDDN